MITTRMLTLEEASQRADELAPKIQEALAHGRGETSIQDLYAGCLTGDTHIWAVEDSDKLVGVCVTRFNYFNQYKQLQIVTLTADGWLTWGAEAHKRLEEFAEVTGCSNIAVYGRKGWERALQQEIPEYTHAYSVFIMEISNDNVVETNNG